LSILGILNSFVEYLFVNGKHVFLLETQLNGLHIRFQVCLIKNDQMLLILTHFCGRNSFQKVLLFNLIKILPNGHRHR
jgi:hypothetical protein